MRFVVLAASAACAITLAACATAAPDGRLVREPVSYLESSASAADAQSQPPGARLSQALGSSNGCSIPNTFALAPSAVPAVSPLDAPIANRAGLLTFDSDP